MNACPQVLHDTGSTLQCGVNVLNRVGVCSEHAWPYDVAKVTVKPPREAYEEATLHKFTAFTCVGKGKLGQQLMTSRISQGAPVAIGIITYESFALASIGGMVQLPGPKEQCTGAHAVLCVGYDMDEHIFIMQNSWGTGWGDSGYFYLPFEYLTDQRGLCTGAWSFTSLRTFK
jgi:C1A family cysteine protease